MSWTKLLYAEIYYYYQCNKNYYIFLTSGTEIFNLLFHLYVLANYSSAKLINFWFTIFYCKPGIHFCADLRFLFIIFEFFFTEANNSSLYVFTAL